MAERTNNKIGDQFCGISLMVKLEFSKLLSSVRFRYPAQFFINKKESGMSVVPIRKQVLVAQIARKTVSSGGIIIENARSVSDNETARVLAIGSEVTEVAVGDEVLLDWSKGNPVTIDGEQRIVIKEEFIIAVLERD